MMNKLLVRIKNKIVTYGVKIAEKKMIKYILKFVVICKVSLMLCGQPKILTNVFEM